MDANHGERKLEAMVCAAYRICGMVQYTLETKVLLEDELLTAVPLLVPVGLWSLWKLYASNNVRFLAIGVLLYTCMVSFFVWYERKGPKRRTTHERRWTRSAPVENEAPVSHERTSKDTGRTFREDLKLDEELVIREAHKELEVLCETVGIVPPSPLQSAPTPEQVEKLLAEITRVCRAIGISKPPDTELLEEVWEYIQTINAFVGLPALRKRH